MQMTKKYSKSKTGPNQAGPKYRTPDHFKGSVFSAGSKFSGDDKGKKNIPQVKFNPAQFKTQHKG
jgi:hypothetical protein